jgi:hypothetical protein
MLREIHTSVKVENAINRAIGECNRFISTKEILSEYFGLKLYDPRLYNMDPHVKKYVSKKITDYMKSRYKKYKENSATIVWDVKP